MLSEGSSPIVWDAERLRIAADAAGVGLWSWNVDTDAIKMDKRAHELWGVPWGTPVTFEVLSDRIHPADLTMVRVAFEATRTAPGAYEIDFRIQHSDEVRWISARGQGADAGVVDRSMFGVFLDVTKRKQAEEAREMLAGEMSHRVKNLFAIAAALTSIAARSAATTTEMARDLVQRLTALGRAHDLVRPAPGGKESKALLGDMVAVLLAPYAEGGAAGDRIQVSIPAVPVGETAATTLALIVHELATNSLKHGALSMANGRLDLICAVQGDEVMIVWTETGSTSFAAPVGDGGFGTKLVRQSVFGQLGGAIEFDWRQDSLIVTLRMSKARLAV